MRATRLPAFLLVLGLLAGPGAPRVQAQDAAAGSTGTPQTDAATPDGDAPLMRGSIDTTEPPLPAPLGAATPTGREPIGPPLFGPTGDEPIGLRLAGPDPIGAIATPPLRPGDTPTNGLRLLLVEDQPDPYAPLGIRAGSFLFLPALEIGLVATDNPDGGPDRENRLGALFAPELLWSSDWARHQLGGEVRANLLRYGDERIDATSAEAKLAGRLDISQDTALGATAGYRFSTESASSDDAPAGAVKRPGVHAFSGTTLLTHRFGRFATEAEAAVERTIYEDATLAGGDTVSQDDRDTTLGSLRLRGAFQMSGALTPFVEGAAGRVVYDRETDSEGFRRGAQWWALRGGLVVDLGPKVGGEVSIGYRGQNYEDERLKDFGAVSANAQLVWSPERLTTVRFALVTGIDPTTLTSASAELTHSASVTVERRMRTDLTASVGGAVALSDFVGIARTDVTMSGFAELGYDFNRMARLSARYDYSRTDSDAEGEDEEENRFTLRLRLKR